MYYCTREELGLSLNGTLESAAGAVTLPGGLLAAGDLPLVMGRVLCEGTETQLSNCTADLSPTGNCGAAALLCQSMKLIFC